MERTIRIFVLDPTESGGYIRIEEPLNIPSQMIIQKIKNEGVRVRKDGLVVWYPAHQIAKVIIDERITET